MNIRLSAVYAKRYVSADKQATPLIECARFLSDRILNEINNEFNQKT